VGSALATASGRRTPWYVGDWLWPVLVAAVVALVTAVAVVAVRLNRDGRADQFLAATETPVGPPATARAGALTAPPSPGARATLPEVTDPEPLEQAPPPPRPQRLMSWPAKTDGFTVVLASVPDGGRAGALTKAKGARDAGLTQVGVLNSSRYPSLHPGYLVVFSGVYENRAAAEDAVDSVRAKGYKDAYAAQVAR
jgi:hypothetical protein